MDFNEILKLVESKTGREYKACPNGWYNGPCPVSGNHDHGDQNPSFGLRDDGKGWTAFKCFAECTTEAICSALGIRKGDLYHRKNGSGCPTKPSKVRNKKKAYSTIEDAVRAAETLTGGNHTNTWTYQDVEGNDALCVARFDLGDSGRGAGKEFRPIHKSNEGWHIGDPPGPLPLYRLAHLSGSNECVYVNEGEKAADATIGYCVPIALAEGAIKKDPFVSVTGNHQFLNPAVVHMLAA